MTPDFSRPWPFLKPGDHVALIAPGGGIFPDLSGLLRALEESAEEAGLAVKLYGHIHPEDTPNQYYSAPAGERLSSLLQALQDPTVKAIWCLRGGFGALEVVDLLGQIHPHPLSDAGTLPPKPLIGFSDFTHVLNSAVHHRWPAIHGPNGISVWQRDGRQASASAHEVWSVLKGSSESVRSSWRVLSPGPQEDGPAPLRGGNLSVLQRTLGTPSAFQGAGYFVFLEDNEPFTRADDLFLSLIRAGALGNPATPPKALLMGSVETRAESADPLFAQREADRWAALLDTHAGFSVPILWNPAFGHGDHNSILLLGAPTRLTWEGSTVSLESAFVD